MMMTMAAFGSQKRRPSPASWRTPHPPSMFFCFSVCALLGLFALLLYSRIDIDRSQDIMENGNRGRYARTVGEKVEEDTLGVSRRDHKKGGGGSSYTMDELWGSKQAKYFYGCSNATNKFATAEENTLPNRYLMIATSGGLNQQRTGITDAVVAARILNATLVIPKLDQKSFWKDSSNFSEIFDVDWFISSLSNDVKIIKELPKKVLKKTRPYSMRVPRKCTPHCYQQRVLPVLLKKHAVELTKFDFRLANRLDTELQKLRCRANYHALRFTKEITQMGHKLVERMRKKSGHFVALHLRFEPDMLAFSGCYFGGGENERTELGEIRRRWKTLHKRDPDKERRHGKCPLTPEEVGLMLRALGFGSDVFLYVASGEVYGGEKSLAPLKQLFPNYYSKYNLATSEELAPYASHQSQMAALDYIACDESDAFVTNNNGNMAKMLAGRRRYFGHKRTIRPNGRKLYSLFLNRSTMSWDVFASKVRSSQKGFMGEPKELRPGRGEFHENPSACICELPGSETTKTQNVESIVGRKGGKESIGKDQGGNTQSTNVVVVDEPVDEDDAGAEFDPDWSDLESGEENLSAEKVVKVDGAEQDYDTFIRSDEPELEELVSD